MRIAPLLLVGSLLANAALIWVVVQRPGSQPVAAGAVRAAAPKAAAAGTAQKDLAALRAALVSGDSNALAAAGCSPEVLRALAMGRAFDRLQTRLREAAPPRADERYWRRRNQDRAFQNRARLELEKAQAEFTAAVRDVYGFDMDSLFSGRPSRYAYLPDAKQQQLLRIEQDYREMMSEVQIDSSGIQLPSDRERLKLLREERERDIAALLSPAERDVYDLHESQAANEVMWRYGEALDTEEDFRRVVALQKAFNDRFTNVDGPMPPERARERREAEEQLRQSIDAMLTPDQRAALKRANDSDYTVLSSLTQRLSLPNTATDQVMALRTSYASQSMAIQRNSDLSDQQRRTQLQALATRAQDQLRTVLGTEGSQVYAQRAGWVNWLKNGAAFTTNREDAPGVTYSNRYQSVYQIPAARTPPRPPQPTP